MKKSNYILLGAVSISGTGAMGTLGYISYNEMNKGYQEIQEITQEGDYILNKIRDCSKVTVASEECTHYVSLERVLKDRYEEKKDELFPSRLAWGVSVPLTILFTAMGIATFSNAYSREKKEELDDNLEKALKDLEEEEKRYSTKGEQ